ncbi:MAG: sensor histidine kinase [Dehalococcoidia bacterium]
MITRFFRWRIMLLTMLLALNIVGILYALASNNVLGPIVAIVSMALMVIVIIDFFLPTMKAIKSVTNAMNRINSEVQTNVQGQSLTTPIASLETLRISNNKEDFGLTKAFNHMSHAVSSTVDNLSMERDTLAVVLDTMADGVISIDSEGKISIFNNTAKDMFGISDRALIGLRLVDTVNDYEILDLVSQAQIQTKTLHSDVEIISTKTLLHVTATPIGDNAYGGVLLTIHDQTEMKLIETSRREFVSNVSHELRSPIASIAALLELLSDGALEDSDTALDFVNRMTLDAKRMASIVSDLLELSMIESGQLNIELKEMNLLEVVADSMNYVNNQNSDDKAEIKVSIDSNIVVMGHKDKLLQILVNLIQNASRFTDKDDYIYINSQMDLDDSHVMVSVRDTGTGIPQEHLPHLFERFYKVDRSRRDEGTGLGLSIVKNLVQMHGGDLSVDSVEGEGSTFTFTLMVP